MLDAKICLILLIVVLVHANKVQKYIWLKNSFYYILF